MKKSVDKKEKAKMNKNQSELVTKESLCAVCALFSLLALLMLCTRALVFGDIGAAVHSFLVGVFGYMAYPVALLALYASASGLIGKRYVKNRKAAAFIAFTVVCAALIVHTATTYSWSLEGYAANCFAAGQAFPASTAAGWLGGVVVFLVASATTKIGALIIFSALTLFFGYLSYVAVNNFKQNPKEQEKVTTAEQKPVAPVEIPLTNAEPQPTQTPYQETPSTVNTLQEPVQGYGHNDFTENMPQRPAFSLSDEAATSQEQTSESEQPTQVGGAFSPFGTLQNMRKPESDGVENSYEKSRAFLFGSTPAENYQRNLIFDPNANVNKRASAPATPAPTLKEGYSSYADAYQNSVNAGTANRPTMVFSDRSENDQSRAYESEPITPLEPIPTSPILPQEPVSYPSIEETGSTAPFVEEKEEEQEILRETRDANRRHDYMDLFSPSNPNVFGNSSEDRDFAQETFTRRGEERGTFEEEVSRERESLLSTREEPRFEEIPAREEPRGRGIDIFDSEEKNIEDDPYTLRSETESPRRMGFVEEPESKSDRFESEERSSRFEVEERGRFVEPEPKLAEPPIVKKPEPTPPPAQPKPRVIRPYVRVPIDDFDCRDVEPTQNPEEVEETKATIIATLDDFKVTGASIASVTFGPTVTRYNVTIPRNISPRKVVSLDQSIAISLHSSGVNVYPNYEDGVVSIEVPNKERQFVQLGCMLKGDTFVNAKSSSLMFTMGKDVANRKVYGDISKMTHLLVAGSSGSGKSVFLGSLIISLIYKYSPEELRLILIDPKKTEFVLYNNLPHLMINEIITDVNKSVQSLNWAIGEMNRRYGLFEKMSRAGTYVVNLDQYNAQLKKEERLPKIVIIIDELADLMLAAKKDIEDRIQNLTQKARAAGIHLVVATQRPSTDVITGVIKSNLATRIAFAVATDVDSRVILDQSGAQKLLGKGDFLYTMQGINTPVRVQSAFISAEDSQKVVNFIKANNEAYYDESATAFINNARGGGGGGGDSFGGGDEVEPVYIDALRYVILSESASISMIQRKCSVGYNKAGKIVEWMEEMGYISSFDGAKARKVLITKEEFESKYGTL